MSLRFPPLRWTTLLLAASIALTTIGVVEASRSVRSQRAVAEHALRDYAGFAAWSYQQHLRDRLARATEEVLGAFNHGHDVHRGMNTPSVTTIPHYIYFDQLCQCHQTQRGPSPFAFVAFQLGTDTLGVALNAYPRPQEGWVEDRPVPIPMVIEGNRRFPAEVRRWINDTITAQVRAKHDVGRFPVIVATRGSVRRFFTYTVMPRLAGDTIVYGAEYEPEAFEKILASTMTDSDLLPSAFTSGRPVRDLVQLEVTDASGRPLFTSDSVSRWMLDDSASLGEGFGALRVRAQIRASMADQLIIGGLPRSRLPFLLALLGIAAALSFVAIQQIRREGELARLREDFVASISHELRTPLAQMRLYLETLRLGRFTTEAQRSWSLDNVERETTRLSHLVERVLRFSRANRADADPRQPVDVAAELERIVDEFRPIAEARGARVEIRAGEVPSVVLQTDALRHIALNLLDNAVKYGPRGQTVRASLQRDGRDVRLELADEGPGIPEADRERIWQPYQRGATAGHTAGSGIGLSIVRDLAVAHGGRAWVAPTPAGEQGARIVVTLPAMTQAPADEGGSVDAFPAPLAAPSDTEPVRR
ncbi:MAG TPA: HAMP domain-containing sensor histidine kinase [Gemmatimonadaceae bacterium]|jgi:signal transduction histidine kinase|nr:HAMP domain-containing sensor histidine kinase [Gemmatimonadaceae bacterium]